jgi:excisionase family DNA binding protein
VSDELLTASEAARVLKLSLGAFYALRRRQHIPSAGVGRRLLFRREDLVRARAGDPVSVVDFAELGRRHARGERLHG